METKRFLIGIWSQNISLISVVSREISAISPLRFCRAASHSFFRPIFACKKKKFIIWACQPMLDRCNMAILETITNTNKVVDSLYVRSVKIMAWSCNVSNCHHILLGFILKATTMLSHLVYMLDRLLGLFLALFLYDSFWIHYAGEHSS